MMVAAAAMLVLFLIIAAVVLNVGWWLRDKRDAQNDVDAAVLAGAQELPDEVAASTVAEAWAARNNVTSGDLICCEFEDLNDDGSADLIRATVEREPGLLAGNLLDVGTVTVTAKAAAAKQQAVAGCVMPWGVKATDTIEKNWGLPDPELEQLVGFHASDFDTPGNFGALQLYGGGMPPYREAIKTPCGTGTEGVCDQTDPELCVGCTLECKSQTGVGGINTHRALTERDGLYGPESPESTCDVTTYDQALDMIEGPPPGAEKCADARAVLIPIIDAFPPQGQSAPLQILGVATFCIAGWDRKPPYTGKDVDLDGLDDMVWGYFLPGESMDEAWNIRWGFSNDPFAPIKILLYE